MAGRRLGRSYEGNKIIIATELWICSFFSISISIIFANQFGPVAQ